MIPQNHSGEAEKDLWPMTDQEGGQGSVFSASRGMGSSCLWQVCPRHQIGTDQPTPSLLKTHPCHTGTATLHGAIDMFYHTLLRRWVLQNEDLVPYHATKVAPCHLGMVLRFFCEVSEAAFLSFASTRSTGYGTARRERSTGAAPQIGQRFSDI